MIVVDERTVDELKDKDEEKIQENEPKAEHSKKKRKKQNKSSNKQGEVKKEEIEEAKPTPNLQTVDNMIQSKEETMKTLDQIIDSDQKKTVIQSKDKEEEHKDSSNSLVSMINIACKIHGQKALCIDSSSFILMCKECVFDGKNGQIFDYSYKPKSEPITPIIPVITPSPTPPPKKKSEDYTKPIDHDHPIVIIPKTKNTEDQFECYAHPKKKASFYCDECHMFVCKLCFADIHCKHLAHLPERISENFKKHIDSSISDVQNLKPTLEDSLEEVKQIYERLKDKKEEILKIPQTSIHSITQRNVAQLNIFNDIFINKLNNTDKEINEDYLRHQKIKEKTMKYLQEWEDYKTKILNENKSLGNAHICKFMKSKTENYKELNAFITNSNNFLDNKLTNSLIKAKETKENMINNLQLLSKSLLLYENSSVSSISTGQACNSILLRRFIRFIYSEVHYFKSTSIIIKTNVSVFLTGMSICGLYVHNQDANNPNLNMDKNLASRGSLRIAASVYELQPNDVKGPELYREESYLYGVTEKTDPSFLFNFTKGTKLAKDKRYLLNLENLSNVNYCDLWIGSIGKTTEEQLTQIIKCHNTQTEFTFSHSQGIQTDFNEFTTGLIEGILFAKN